MIEIIVIIFLCITNSKNAKARRKSSVAPVFYTLGLWFGAEIVGAFLGGMLFGYNSTGVVYLIALIFAAAGGVGSYFIAKSGTVAGQNPAMPYQPAAYGQTPTYPAQPQQAQAPYPAPQTQPVNLGQQVQPQASYPAPQTQPVLLDQQPQAVVPPQPPVQSATATIVFTAKKVMGQFLVSSAAIEVNGVPYQVGFKEPITITVPAGNVQIESYLNYMGKSGKAQMHVTLEPNQTYNLCYKSPAVVTGSGTLEFS